MKIKTTKMSDPDPLTRRSVMVESGEATDPRKISETLINTIKYLNIAQDLLREMRHVLFGENMDKAECEKSPEDCLQECAFTASIQAECTVKDIQYILDKL